jgi:hypothetical protein
MGGGGVDFVPGTDFIPGSDLVPGVTDVLGIDMPSLSDVLGVDAGDWAPGIDQSTAADQLGNTDWANGIDKSTAADQLGNTDWANGIDKSTAADQLGNTDWANGIDKSTAADQLGNGKTLGSDWAKGFKIPKLPTTPTGTGTGTGTKTGAGGTTIVNAGSPAGSTGSTMPVLTGDVMGGSSANLYDFSPNFGSAPLSTTNTAAPQLHFADGGEVPGHEPQFYSEGGLGNRYVQGDGDGTSDSVPAMLATGEFVIPADVVSSLGNGSSDSGASVLDQFLATIRAHKHDHNPDELPPDSEGPLAYLQKAKNKVDA